MTLDIEAVQQGLADAAATITGLRTESSIGDTITPPYFAPVELDFDYLKSFGRLTEMVFSCGVYTSRGNSKAGRKLLVGYLAQEGDTSIPQALRVDRKLGGACKELVVERVTGAYRLYTIGGVDYLGAIFDVRIWG